MDAEIKFIGRKKERETLLSLLASGYIQRGTADLSGIQIDLVLDRRDQVISLFEMKYYTAPWAMTKQEANELSDRIALFKAHTKTPKQVFLTVVCASGLVRNEQSQMVVDSVVELDDLFEPG